MPGENGVPRRDRILAAAREEFARHGYAGARVERIAAAAGVNKQLLFHYFGSKGGLHLAALDSLLEQPSGPPPSNLKAPTDRLRDLVDRVAATTEAHPSLLGLLTSSPHDPRAAAMADAWRTRAKLQASGILQDGQRSGHVRDDVDVGAVAEVVVAATLGLAAASDLKTVGRRESYLEALLKIVMDYCAWR